MFDAPVLAIGINERLTTRNTPIFGFGLKNGAVGLIELTSEDAIILCEIEPDNRSPASIVKLFELKNQTHMVVARDDGSIELYWINDSFSSAELVFQTKEKETITGIGVGFITSVKSKEIVFSCYSGAIKSLVDRKHAKKLGTMTEDTTAMTSAQLTKEKLAKQQALEKEI